MLGQALCLERLRQLGGWGWRQMWQCPSGCAPGSGLVYVSAVAWWPGPRGAAPGDTCPSSPQVTPAPPSGTTATTPCPRALVSPSMQVGPTGVGWGSGQCCPVQKTQRASAPLVTCPRSLCLLRTQFRYPENEGVEQGSCGGSWALPAWSRSCLARNSGRGKLALSSGGRGVGGEILGTGMPLRSCFLK